MDDLAYVGGINSAGPGALRAGEDERTRRRKQLHTNILEEIGASLERNSLLRKLLNAAVASALPPLQDSTLVSIGKFGQQDGNICSIYFKHLAKRTHEIDCNADRYAKEFLAAFGNTMRAARLDDPQFYTDKPIRRIKTAALHGSAALLYAATKGKMKLEGEMIKCEPRYNAIEAYKTFLTYDYKMERRSAAKDLRAALSEKTVGADALTVNSVNTYILDVAASVSIAKTCNLQVACTFTIILVCSPRFP